MERLKVHLLYIPRTLLPYNRIGFVISYKWVKKIMIRINGSTERLKAHLVLMASYRSMRLIHFCPNCYVGNLLQFSLSNGQRNVFLHDEVIEKVYV